jgi:hypothetical protein
MGFLDKFHRFSLPVADKNSHFKLAQNGLAEKLKPMLKNRCIAITVFDRLFREKLVVFISFGATKVAE